MPEPKLYSKLHKYSTDRFTGWVLDPRDIEIASEFSRRDDRRCLIHFDCMKCRDKVPIASLNDDYVTTGVMMPPDTIEGRSIAEGGPQYFQPTGGFRTIAYFLGQAIQPDEENYAIARAFGNHGAMLTQDGRVLRTTAEVNAFYKSEVDAGLRNRRPPIPADERTVRYFMPFEESGEVEFRMRANVPEYLPTECLKHGLAAIPTVALRNRLQMLRAAHPDWENAQFEPVTVRCAPRPSARN